MADVKSTGKYDYMKPDDNNERRKKVETAGQHDTDFETCAIAIQEIVKDNDKNAKITKKNTSTEVISSVKRDIILSTELAEGMKIKAQNSKVEKKEKVEEKDKDY